MPPKSLDHWRTERLILERVRPEDFADLRLMHQDPVLMASIGGLRSDEETRRYLDEQLGHWAAHHFGIWMAREAATSRLAGRGGLRLTAIDGRAETELAYALVPEAWRRGLATELARACVSTAFDLLGCADLVAYTRPENRASRRVMEKCGFSYDRDFVHKAAPHVLYRLTAGDWRAAAQSAGERGA